MVALGFIGLPVTAIDSRWEAVRQEVVNPPLAIESPADVDAWVNSHIAYREDSDDEWAAPSLTLKRGFGDCEDFAILKRAILRAKGVPNREILFLIVRDTITRRDHAVLIYKGRVLDSVNSLSLPESEERDYTPMTGWTGPQRWIFGRKH